MIKLQLIVSLAFVFSFSLGAHAALPGDEKSIEQEIDAEDDSSPEPELPSSRIEESEDVPPPTSSAISDESSKPATTPPKPTEDQVEAPPPEPQPLHKEQIYDGTTRATSSGRGEPIFDWSKHPNEREVEHPFREKGLIRITKDRDYMYKTSESEQHRAAAFRAGPYIPTNLKNPDAEGQAGANFDENYQQTDAPALMFNYEWQLWRSPIGKWGLEVGTGAYIAQGNGHFVAGANAAKTPREVFTFVLIPLNVGAVYRLQLFHRQMVVPYASGGGTLFGFAEMRDDNKAPKFGGAPGAYFAGGLALNLTYFDGLSRIALDREYGINAVYLTGEYRQIVSLSRYDFTSSLINGGFLMEY